MGLPDLHEHAHVMALAALSRAFAVCLQLSVWLVIIHLLVSFRTFCTQMAASDQVLQMHRSLCPNIPVVVAQAW